MYEGSSIKRKVGVFKRDANSVARLLTHRYRNPFCESCVKAKMRHFRSRTGAFKREVKTFGDLVTFDFVTASKWRAGICAHHSAYIHWTHSGLSNCEKRH